MENKQKYKCPCCGFITYSKSADDPETEHWICPVCRWENDFVQTNDPNFRGGANRMSLNEARENFQIFGA